MTVRATAAIHPRFARLVNPQPQPFQTAFFYLLPTIAAFGAAATTPTISALSKLKVWSKAAVFALALGFVTDQTYKFFHRRAPQLTDKINRFGLPGALTA